MRVFKIFPLHWSCCSKENYFGNYERIVELLKKVKNCLKMSSHYVNAFSALVVTLVD